LANIFLSFNTWHDSVCRKLYLSKIILIMTSFVTYEGDLRTKSIHLASKDSFITDAPIDNNGKGEAFSPTDTVASALASCILTIMGIKAKNLDLDLRGTKAQVTKVMASEPRRIEEIKIEINVNKSFDIKIQRLLERAALNCPVAKSLHPDLKQNITFNWPA
jgi:uncharacterized OsmC-like protein